MPPRPARLAIVLFWFATTGWLAYSQLAPLFRADEPPPFVIDVAEETFSQTTPVNWVVSRAGKPVGKARTYTVYRRDDDTFELHNEVRTLNLSPNLFVTVVINKLDNVFRVTHEGELRAMETDTDVTLMGVKLSARLTGEVTGRRLLRRVTVEAAGVKADAALEPVPAPTGSVLNPLQPTARIVGLRPGQQWSMPLLDPRSDALRASVGPVLKQLQVAEEERRAAEALVNQAFGEAGHKVLLARVADDVRQLPGNGPEACHVIEYRDGDAVVARTWVRASDGRVLRQEAGEGNDLMVLQRQ